MQDVSHGEVCIGSCRRASKRSRRASQRALVTSLADAPRRLQPPPAARAARARRDRGWGGAAHQRWLLDVEGEARARLRAGLLPRRSPALASLTGAATGPAQL